MEKDFLLLIKKDEIKTISGFKNVNNKFYEVLSGYIFISKNKFDEFFYNKNFNDIIGEFVYIKYNILKKEIEILLDKLGRYPIYLFKNKEYIGLSNNYWKLISELKKFNIKFSINREFLYETILYGTNFFNNTHIFEIKKLIYGSYLKIDLEKSKINEMKYWDFKLNSQVKDIDEASKLIEYSIIETLEKAKKEDKTYGIGVSGGLDSRILLYYAKKLGFKIHPFIISKKRPNFLFLAKDIKAAKNVCKNFNENLEIYDPFKYDFFKRLKEEIKNNPVSPSNADTYVLEKFNFDYLLTGANGYIIGGGVFPENLLYIDKENFLKNFMFFIYPKSFNTLKRIFRYTKKNFKHHEQLNIEYELKKVHYELYEKIVNYTYSVVQKSQNLVEANLKLYHQAFGQHNFNGVFESISGQYTSYSIYTTYLLNYLDKFSPEHIVERNALKNLLKKLPKNIYKTEGQSPHSSLNINILDTLDYLIRGYGVRNREYDFKRYFKKFKNYKFETSEILGYKNLRNSSRLFHDFVKHNIICMKILEKNDWRDLL
jgi:hypothetical protein